MYKRQEQNAAIIALDAIREKEAVFGIFFFGKNKEYNLRISRLIFKGATYAATGSPRSLFSHDFLPFRRSTFYSVGGRFFRSSESHAGPEAAGE